MIDLADLTWPEAGQRSQQVLVVPVGSTEQHGPHLPLSTDTDVARAIAVAVAAGRSDVIVAPALPYGASGEHAGFAGTLSIGQAALEHVVVELVRSATATFGRVLLLSGHGGNAAPLARAVRLLRTEVRLASGVKGGWGGWTMGGWGAGGCVTGDGVTGGMVDGTPYDTRVRLSSQSRTWSVFASDTLALNERTHLTASGRYNRTRVTSRDAIVPGGGAGSLDGDHLFARFNPALGLTFAASKSLTGYVGINQGSRAPSAIELGCADPANPCKLPNSMAGDPPLKQVVTTTLEAGLRGSVPGGTQWNVGVFRADNRDDIMFVADDQAGFGYFRNFGETRRQGVEAGFSTRMAAVRVGANYTWLDATYRSDEVVNGSSNSGNDAAQAGFPGVNGSIEVRAGSRIPLVPKHLLKLFAEVPLGPAWSLGADITAIGGSLARGNENNQHQPDGTYYLGRGRSGGYAVLNLSGDWRPSPPLKFFAQINNVFDRKYNTAAQLGATAFDANGNFQARPFAADVNGDRPLQHSTFYAAGAPRTVWVGVRYEFGD